MTSALELGGAETSEATDPGPTGAATPLALADTVGGAPSPASLEQGDVGRYILGSRLGAGGMGVVFEAYDPALARKVAIKLLHGGNGLDEQARVRREAEALARLSHPNVVQVFEVGESRGGTFIAMELVVGTTLRQWQRAKARSTNETLAMYRKAGAGLAAAHAAGLVHRDFKPDNVQIGTDGRPRVLDFGLARAEQTMRVLRSEQMIPTMVGQRFLENALTEAGAVMGTLAYMSPEQHRDANVDEASDQFSFCVALFEALYGVHPFAADTPLMMAVAAIEGDLRAVPANSRVPRALHCVLVKGLSKEPGERHPSMDALLGALAACSKNSATRWLGAGITAIGAAGLGLWSIATAPQACGDPAEHLAGVWDPARRDGVQSSMLETGLPFADETAERVTTTLDAYADSWVDAKTQACENGELLDLRTACLERRRTAMRALVDVFAQADTKVTTRAIDALASLKPIEACSDSDALLARVPGPPANESEEVESIRQILARSLALSNAGQHRESRELAEQAVERTKTVEYSPIIAASLIRLAGEHTGAESGATARELYVEAYWLAVDTKDDAHAAQAAHGVLRTALRSSEGLQWARRWYRFAESAIDRQPSPEAARSRLLTNWGRFLHIYGDLEGARATFERAIELERSRAEVAPARLRMQRGYLAQTLARLEEFDEAVRLQDGLVAEVEAIYGTDHPKYGEYLFNTADVDARSGAKQRAYEKLERVRELFARVYGPRSRKVAFCDLNMGGYADMEGHYEVARKHAADAVAVFSETTTEPMLAAALFNLGGAYFNQDRYDEALAHAMRAHALYEQQEAPDELRMADSFESIAAILLELGRLEEAAAAYARVLAIRERTLPPLHTTIAVALANMANFHQRTGRDDRAIAFWERAIQLRERAGPVDAAIVDIRFELAESLWRGGGDKTRARALAEGALAALRSGELSERRGLTAAYMASAEKIETWLAEHPLS